MRLPSPYKFAPSVQVHAKASMESGCRLSRICRISILRGRRRMPKNVTRSYPGLRIIRDKRESRVHEPYCSLAPFDYLIFSKTLTDSFLHYSADNWPRCSRLDSC